MHFDLDSQDPYATTDGDPARLVPNGEAAARAYAEANQAGRAGLRPDALLRSGGQVARCRAQGVGRLVKDNLKVGAELLGGHLQRPDSSVQDLAQGEGGLVKVEEQTAGAYRPDRPTSYGQLKLHAPGLPAAVKPRRNQRGLPLPRLPIR